MNMESKNLKGEFIWRMFGNIVMAFCREFGSGDMRSMVQYIADNDDFWKLVQTIEDLDPMQQPFKRGAHDFLRSHLKEVPK
jgi:hypothetical protein